MSNFSITFLLASLAFSRSNRFHDVYAICLDSNLDALVLRLVALIRILGMRDQVKLLIVVD